MARVAVTGVGLVTPLGMTWQVFSDNVVNGRGVIAPATLRFESRSDVQLPLATIPEFNCAKELPNFKANSWDRATKIAVAAARQCIEASGLNGSDLGGLIAGVSTNSAEGLDESYYRLMRGNGRVSPMTIPRSMPNAPAAAICIDQQITGLSYTVASACSSANQAMINAAMLVRSGQLQSVLCGATESSLTFSNVSAWLGMRVTADDTCRPFCGSRKGLVLGEGAAFFVFENFEAARCRGASILAEISGWGMTSDAQSMTTPCQNGITEALKVALADAKLAPSDIGYMNAHGTGTPLNDVTESAAIQATFNEQNKALPVSSTKSMHGHLLGASGAIEMAATIAAVRHGVAPPTINWEEPDGDIHINVVKNEPMEVPIDHALSASYAFGGHNTVLAVSAHG